MLSFVLRRVATSRLALAAYAVVGLLVANSHRYFAHISGIKPDVSAILAVVLWPLLLIGVNVHIK
jgi:hypothetical protein